MKREYLALGIVALALAGCGRGQSASVGAGQAASQASANEVSRSMEAMGGAPNALPAPPAEPSTEAPPTAALPRKIIYTAEVSLVCDDLGKVGGLLESKVKELGGYISGRQLDGAAGTTRTASWTVRVPVGKFEALLSSLPGMGELQSTATSSEDVSEEFYDATARLKNKRVEEERLVQHLRASTGKLSEILAVEKEISRVREEIERIEGRLRYLSNQADLSTITIRATEVRGYIPPKPPTFGTEVARAFTNSLDVLGATLKGLVLALIVLLPWLAIFGGLVFGLLFALKRLGGKKGA